MIGVSAYGYDELGRLGPLGNGASRTVRAEVEQAGELRGVVALVGDVVAGDGVAQLVGRVEISVITEDGKAAVARAGCGDGLDGRERRGARA